MFMFIFICISKLQVYLYLKQDQYITALYNLVFYTKNLIIYTTINFKLSI